MIKRTKIDISSVTKAKENLDLANIKVQKNTNDIIDICKGIRRKKKVK